MTRALLLLALVVAVGTGASWFIASDDLRTTQREPDEELGQPLLRAGLIVDGSASEVASELPRARPLHIPAATSELAASHAAAGALPTCEVVVRLSGRRHATNNARVTLLTTGLESEFGSGEERQNPEAQADRLGVARLQVPAGLQIHGCVVKHGSEWVWSSQLLPSPKQLDASGSCFVELDHAVPGEGGSISGHLRALDGRELERTRVVAEVTAQLAAHESWDPGYVTGRPFFADVDELGRYKLSRFSGAFELSASLRDTVPLWTWRGTLAHGTKLKDLDFVFVPSVMLPVSVPALVDQPKGSVLVIARLAAAQREALLGDSWAASLPAPPPGVERNDRVAGAHLPASANLSLTVPQHAVWVSVIRGGAPLALRHNEQRVFEVLHDPVHGPLTLVLEEEQ
ncbi:MAG: hypothetical protein DHS20C15_23300 [Planctomycetota bacterium]|nr:MAG: hypothetical protein DHS20C15_23300 [Planctomycetota bacterium]